MPLQVLLEISNELAVVRILNTYQNILGSHHKARLESD